MIGKIKKPELYPVILEGFSSSGLMGFAFYSGRWFGVGRKNTFLLLFFVCLFFQENMALKNVVVVGIEVDKF